MNNEIPSTYFLKILWALNSNGYPVEQHITTNSVFIESIWPNILFSSDTYILFVHVECTHVLPRKENISAYDSLTVMKMLQVVL